MRNLRQFKALENMQNWKYTPLPKNNNTSIMDPEYIKKQIEARRKNNKMQEIDEHLQKIEL